MPKKRVFILGAGFSKSAGLPLATELTSLILDSDGLKSHEEMQQWVSDLKERAACLAGERASKFKLNIEQLFEYAKFDEELWRMRQQEELVGRSHGQTSWEVADGIAGWLSYMQEEVVGVISRAQMAANYVPIGRFVDHLRDDDAVISFNYDTLIETALTRKGRIWNHGLADLGSGGVTILKMHGSVDWFLLERGVGQGLKGLTQLFSKTDTNVTEHSANEPVDEAEYAAELWRADDADVQQAMVKSMTGLSMFRIWPGLAGLGSYKPLHRLPGSALTWVAAFDALRRAAELCVIGFSMSPYDAMTRFHFGSVMHARKHPVEKALVVDPNANRLARVFSDIFAVSPTREPKPAQDADWGKLLS